ncbi:prepilin-type N-terminal cleavage/methylation domain-containing protein, partial [Polaromonas sp.]|uniref:prepilin-type N-terminal cleavage/methylation domain-containing protein n=1 Tax=Polaromonas sp. TaxID=1869339 RepID=UPI003522F60E
GAGLAWGGPALRPIAPTLAAAGASPRSLAARIRHGGFTLLELLIVVAIMAVATAGVGLSLRDSSATALEREAQRLAALLESARAQSRMTAIPVRWRATATGFAFDGLAGSALPSKWLGQDVQVAADSGVVVLGPEPVIGPQQIRLVSLSDPGRSLTLATDGVRPFAVLTGAAATP